MATDGTQSALKQWCLFCGEEHYCTPDTACKACGGPLVRQKPMGDYGP